MTYEAFRHFADTWGLALLVIVFLMMLLFVFRRGSAERYRQAARIPMEAPESPAESDKTSHPLKTAGAGASRNPADREDRP
ncbi:cbb3-type cytochrome c oxidase subunit 3 [Acuticoccus yangtzensis]|uniref:cbb3-type cytochrome c oxidase subunit 3 n=1 Tax=Acuticoccus yangtzensis TaxID=1443441 RepID=UPI0009497427|nr:cbb3-type cytochrome c oxidase subunit 3 [Acuticoccus yangtzensis]